MYWLQFCITLHSTVCELAVHEQYMAERYPVMGSMRLSLQSVTAGRMVLVPLLAHTWLGSVIAAAPQMQKKDWTPVPEHAAIGSVRGINPAWVKLLSHRLSVE